MAIKYIKCLYSYLEYEYISFWKTLKYLITYFLYLTLFRVVYEKLCGVVKETDLPIYKHKCEELVPNLRYCAYSIGDSSAIADLKDLRGIAHGDILDKLDVSSMI